jgi:c-di-GMP-binding flagellar brake protein YcgR
VGNNVTRQNESISNLSALKNEKNKDIFFITAKQLIGNDHEATMMVQHLTDLRFTRISETINKVLEQAINK